MKLKNSFDHHSAPTNQIKSETNDAPECSTTTLTNPNTNKCVTMPILWHISNLDLAIQKDPIIIKIPVSLGIDEVEFTFVLIPNWIKEDLDSFASLHLHLTSKTLDKVGEDVEACFKASVQIDDNNEYNARITNPWKFKLGQNSGWGWNKFVSQNELKMKTVLNTPLILKLELFVKDKSATKDITKECITIHSDANRRKIPREFKFVIENFSHFFDANRGNFPAWSGQNFQPCRNIDFHFQLIVKSNNCCDINLVLYSSEQDKCITIWVEIGIYNFNSATTCDTKKYYAKLSPRQWLTIRDFIKFDRLKRENHILNDQLTICGTITLFLDDDGNKIEQIKPNVQIASTDSLVVHAQTQNHHRIGENAAQANKRSTSNFTHREITFNFTNTNIVIQNMDSSILNTGKNFETNNISITKKLESAQSINDND